MDGWRKAMPLPHNAVHESEFWFQDPNPWHWIHGCVLTEMSSLWHLSRKCLFFEDGILKNSSGSPHAKSLNPHVQVLENLYLWVRDSWGFRPKKRAMFHPVLLFRGVSFPQNKHLSNTTTRILKCGGHVESMTAKRCFSTSSVVSFQRPWMGDLWFFGWPPSFYSKSMYCSIAPMHHRVQIYKPYVKFI